MGDTRNTRGRIVKCIQIVKRKNKLLRRGLHEYRRIMLEWLGRNGWVGLIWFRTDAGGGLL